jgi:hypothetical protein
MKKSTIVSWCLVGISLVAFLAAALAPTTKLYVAEVLQQDLIGSSSATVWIQKEREEAYVADHPADSDVQVAGLMTRWRDGDFVDASGYSSTSTVFAEGDKLIAEFPTSPVVYANVLREESNTLKSPEWQGRALINEGEKKAVDDPMPDPSQLKNIADFINHGKAAERLDPRNAYFPLMVSSAYYAAHQNDKAEAELLAGAQDTDWREYKSSEEKGDLKIIDGMAGYGNGVDGIGVVAISDNELFPEYAKFRQVARMTKFEAEEQEVNGHAEQGIALRHALLHYGSLMRHYGRTLICSSVGIAISSIAVDRPDEAPHILPNDSLTGDARIADVFTRRIDAYQSFLRSHGQESEALWAAQELAAGQVVKERSSSYNVFDMRAFFADGLLLAVGIFVVGWALIIGCLSVMLVSIKGLVRLHRAKRSAGAMAGLVLSFAAASFLLAVVFDSVIHLENAANIRTVMQVPVDLGAIDQNRIPTGPVLIGTILLIPFGVFTSVAILIALIRRKSVIKSLTSSYLTVAAPCICLLLLLFTVTVLERAKVDGKIEHAMLMAQKMGEGQYVFQRDHLTWPGLINEPTQR